MTEKRVGFRRDPEVRAESEISTTVQRELDGLTQEEGSLVLARLDALGLDPRDPGFARDRDQVISDTLAEIKLQRKHSEGERKW